MIAVTLLPDVIADLSDLSDLSVADRSAFEQSTRLFLGLGLTDSEADKKLNDILFSGSENNSEDLSYVVKAKLASALYRYFSSAANWGYQFFKTSDLNILVMTTTMDETQVSFAVKNPNWDAGTAEWFLASPASNDTINYFVENLTEKCEAFGQIMAAIAFNGSSFRAYDLPMITVIEAETRARQALGFDKTFPLSWLNRLLS